MDNGYPAVVDQQPLSDILMNPPVSFTEPSLVDTAMELHARHSFYGGKAQQSCGDVFQSIDPSNGKILAEIHSSTDKDLRGAIDSASAAFPIWSTTTPVVRGRILLKAAQLLRERNDELAKLETADTGKPFSETSAVDIVTGADVVEFFAGLVIGGGLNGETIQLRPDAWVYTRKEPLGVCVGIGAWNYPIQMQVILFPKSHWRVSDY